jgi:hypothetical protein
MRALRTGPDSELDDGFGGGAMTAGGRLEGRLLGGNMALLERVCGEVERRDKRFENGELWNLSVGEKKAVRKHFVENLRYSAMRRMDGGRLRD